MKDEILLELARLEIAMERTSIALEKLKEKIYAEDIKEQEKASKND